MKQDFRGDIFPTLMMSGMDLHEDHGLRHIITAAILEEMGGSQPVAP